MTPGVQERPGGGSFRIALWLPVILAATLLVILGLSLLLSGDPERLPSVLIGRPIPSFDLAPIPGEPVPGLSSADFGKGEAALVNVWASWCAPCAEEQPQLLALQKQGIPLYGIDYKDTAEKAHRFLIHFGNPYRAIGADTSGLTGLDFGISGVPETFVVGGDGRVVYRYAGPLTPEIVQEAILPAIERARAIAPRAEAAPNSK